MFAGTNTEAGIVTAVLLLATLTLKPLGGAGALIVTVHGSVPIPVIDALVQLKPLNAGAAWTTGPPTPLKLISIVSLTGLLLAMLS